MKKTYGVLAVVIVICAALSLQACGGATGGAPLVDSLHESLADTPQGSGPTFTESALTDAQVTLYANQNHDAIYELFKNRMSYITGKLSFSSLGDGVFDITLAEEIVPDGAGTAIVNGHMDGKKITGSEMQINLTASALMTNVSKGGLIFSGPMETKYYFSALASGYEYEALNFVADLSVSGTYGAKTALEINATSTKFDSGSPKVISNSIRLLISSGDKEYECRVDNVAAELSSIVDLPCVILP